MRIIKPLTLITLFFLLFSCVGKAQNKYEDVKNLPYINPTPGEITIVGSSPLPPDVEPTSEAFKVFTDCGFNVGMLTGNLQQCNKYFSLIEDIDLKLMVENVAIRTGGNFIDYVKSLKQQPKLAGWKFVDEPLFKDLNTLQNNYFKLWEQDSTHLIYINLVGAQIKAYTGDTPNYREYLKLMQKVFHPAVWSYDLYPFSIKEKRLKVAYDVFYSDLEMFRDISKQTGRPFWAYCQSMAFKNSVLERPAANEAYLRFEAFSALAYGAQGIVYWTYAQRKSTENETYYSALVDLKGKKYPAWYAAQKVNNEIKKFNDVFYNCEVMDCRHTGKTLYRDTKKLKGSIGPFSKIDGEDAGILVSRIVNGENEYIVIVNHDVEKSQNIKFSLKKNNNVVLISDDKESEDVTSGTFNKLLSPGGYLIFQVI